MSVPVSIYWFRRDLRLEDNTALHHALRSGYPVLPVFIFDRQILNNLPEKADRRVDFIHRTLGGLQETLSTAGSSLLILQGTPLDCLKQLTAQYSVQAVFANEDYEPYAIARDTSAGLFLQAQGIAFHTFKDQLVFAKKEIVKDDQSPYAIYTPYSKRWKEKLNTAALQNFPVQPYMDQFLKQPPLPLPGLAELGFEHTDLKIPAAKLDRQIAASYHLTRDIPSLEGTTRLSVHLRFGTISIRRLVAECMSLNEKLLNELIWREFYQMTLWHMPHIATRSYKKEYDLICWRNNEDEFEKWCRGETGYPIVDAGMRELNSTGWMHNRVRMITAGFLCKHLLVDWRWGETYFASRLLDYDLASNNGGWQWSAGSGCDAAPYFRIFNPYTQAKNFDPESRYIHRWIPEFGTNAYPQPIVNHETARKRCLETYKAALNNR